MLKLKLQVFGHLMQRANSLEKTLILGKVERRGRSRRQRMRWLDSITDATDMNLSKLRETAEDREQQLEEPGVLQSMRSQKVRHNNNNTASKGGVT